MTDEIHLSRVQSEFAEHDYPVACDALAASCAGTTVLFADGEADLGELIADIDQDSFEGPGDAFAALQNVLSIEAACGPGQSDGDAWLGDGRRWRAGAARGAFEARPRTGGAGAWDRHGWRHSGGGGRAVDRGERARGAGRRPRPGGRPGARGR